jgi:hypothetical protein
MTPFTTVSNTHLKARLAEIAVKKSRANEIAPLEHRVLEKCSAIGRCRSNHGEARQTDRQDQTSTSLDSNIPVNFRLGEITALERRLGKARCIPAQSNGVTLVPKHTLVAPSPRSRGLPVPHIPPGDAHHGRKCAVLKRAFGEVAAVHYGRAQRAPRELAPREVTLLQHRALQCMKHERISILSTHMHAAQHEEGLCRSERPLAEGQVLPRHGEECSAWVSIGHTTYSEVDVCKPRAAEDGSR